MPCTTLSLQLVPRRPAEDGVPLYIVPAQADSQPAARAASTKPPEPIAMGYRTAIEKQQCERRLRVSAWLHLSLSVEDLNVLTAGDPGPPSKPGTVVPVDDQQRALQSAPAQVRS